MASERQTNRKNIEKQLHRGHNRCSLDCKTFIKEGDGKVLLFSPSPQDKVKVTLRPPPSDHL